MKTIKHTLIGCFLLMVGTQAYGATCDVTYKAKRVQVDRFLFRDVENLKYSSGTITVTGDSIKKCEANAKKELKKKGWTATYTKAKMN